MEQVAAYAALHPPQSALAQAPPAEPPPASAAHAPLGLRQQIEDEMAERYDFLDHMRDLGRPVDASTQARIQLEIADRMQDLKKLERLEGGDEAAEARIALNMAKGPAIEPLRVAEYRPDLSLRCH